MRTTNEIMKAHTPASCMGSGAGVRVSAVVIAHPPCPDPPGLSNPDKRTLPLTLSGRPVTLEAVIRAANARKPKSIIAFVAPFTLS
jgi:hypothetical protein